MNIIEFKENIKDLISKGLTKKAIFNLLIISKNTDWENEILLISSQYENYQKNLLKGILSVENLKLEISRINNSILDINQNIEINENVFSKETIDILKNNLDDNDIINSEIIKFSDKIYKPINIRNQLSLIGLFFIFIGIILIIFAQINSQNKFSIITFSIGSFLLIISFIAFLFIHYKTSKSDNIKTNAKLIDELQNLSINLTRLVSKSQVLAYKHIDKINNLIQISLPIIQKIPFINEKFRINTIEIQNVSTSIVEYSDKSEKLIKDVETALINAEIKKLNEYCKQIEHITIQINEILKK